MYRLGGNEELCYSHFIEKPAKYWQRQYHRDRIWRHWRHPPRAERGGFMGIFQAGLLVPVAVGPNHRWRFSRFFGMEVHLLVPGHLCRRLPPLFDCLPP